MGDDERLVRDESEDKHDVEIQIRVDECTIGSQATCITASNILHYCIPHWCVRVLRCAVPCRAVYLLGTAQVDHVCLLLSFFFWLTDIRARAWDG